MMRAAVLLLLLAVGADANVPSFRTMMQRSSYQPRHHVALTGHGQQIPGLFVKGHQDEKPFVIENTHHDALTGRGQQIPGLFVKGHQDENPFVIENTHHDALTGRGQPIPGLFIKGHVADVPAPTGGGSLRTRPVGNVAYQPVSDEVVLSKVAGDFGCSQVTVKRQWLWLATMFGGFREGTCWQRGYTVSAGFKETSMPVITGIGKTTVRYFAKSDYDAPPAQALAEASPGAAGTGALLLPLLLGLAVAAWRGFSTLLSRRGAAQEPLLAPEKA